MPAGKKTVPSMLRHIRSGQARVRIGGRDYYLGVWGSAGAESKYRAVVAEFLRSGSPPSSSRRRGRGPVGLTVTELIVKYLGDLERRGASDGIDKSIKPALRRLRQSFGDLPAADFGEQELRELQRIAARERGAHGERLTNISKQVSGSLVIDRVTTLSRRLLRARELVEAGKPANEALAAVGLNGYEAARLNKMGLNGQRAERYVRLVYEHGLMRDDSPIREAMTWEQFKERRADQTMFKPNFAEWPMNAGTVEGAANRDLFDTIAAGINGEVNRSMVVTPGEFDRPLINNRILGRMFNQFQAFGYAFANQRLRVMAQMPATYQGWYAAVYFALGGVADAISNDLAGRRTLAQTAAAWQVNPLGMSYAAVDRSGMLGWLGRPLAAADSLGLPFGPKSLFGSDVGSTAARHVTPGRTLTLLGPVAADVDRLGMIAGELADPAQRDRALYDAWKLAPAQNLVWLRLLHRSTGLPVVPEAVAPGAR